MNYQRICYFIKAAEVLNFSEAARQLYIAPQSFGKQISILEKELGAKLFERTTKDIRLTPFGKECYQNFSEPMRALKSSFARMRDLGHGTQREIRICIFLALSRSKIVSPLVEALQAKYTDKDFTISMMDLGELQTSIQNGKSDIGITVTHNREAGWEKCTVYPLADYPARIVVSKEHSWFSKDYISFEDMQDSSFVRMNPPQFSELDYWASIPCHRHIIVENYETMRLELDRGRAFSIMPSEIDEVCDYGYKIFDLPGQPLTYTLSLIHSQTVKSASLEQICDFIRSRF